MISKIKAAVPFVIVLLLAIIVAYWAVMTTLTLRALQQNDAVNTPTVQNIVKFLNEAAGKAQATAPATAN